MNCITVSKYFPCSKETVSLKIIIMPNLNKWYEYDGVVKGLKYSKSSNALLSQIAPWAQVKLEDLCKQNNYSVSLFNEIVGEKFSPDKYFLNSHGVYQVMIGKTISPNNAVKNWYIKYLLDPAYQNHNDGNNDDDEYKNFEKHIKSSNVSISTEPITVFDDEEAESNPFLLKDCENKTIEEEEEEHHTKCLWHFELKIPYECDTNLVICDKNGTKFKLSKF